MAKSDLTQKIEDLHDLRSASINTVLHTFEDVQTNRSLAEQGLDADQLERYRAQEDILRHVIVRMWHVNFAGEENRGRAR